MNHIGRRGVEFFCGVYRRDSEGFRAKLIAKSMPQTDPLSPEDSKALLALCRAGRLYGIEEWIRSGKSLHVAPGIRETPLQVPLKTGFLSLIELLARNEPDIAVKNHALADAVERPRMEYVRLLVEHGAQTSSVPLVDVLRTWNRDIMRFFLDRGADAITGRPFAIAFKERVQHALRVFKEYRDAHPEHAPELMRHAEAARRLHSYEGNLKWVCLMLWLGADPRK